jgi:pimeloyl-ACP methyl ester carboxylesterase
MKRFVAAGLIAVAGAFAAASGPARGQPVASDSSTTTYRFAEVDGLKIFYREAGPRDAPTILLLHGYPSSSRMSATLIPLLADRYHLVAPDYPGFGESNAPPASEFPYTFDHLAKVVDDFTQAIGLRQYVLYQQDYGGPIGMRLAVAPSACGRSWSRMRSLTRMDSGRPGRFAGRSGRTARPMRRR